MDHRKALRFSLVLCGFFMLGGCGGGGGDTSPPPSTFTISGTIYSAAGNYVDSDINDTLASLNKPNNSFAEAQALTSPAVLGGFVNVANAGDPRGQSYTSGDTSDFFSVQLSAGEAVRLAVPDDTDTSANKIGLSLYDSSKTPVGSLLVAAPAVATSVGTSGFYYIEVSAQSGASTYRLMIGAPGVLTASAATAPTGEFVPGEVLVRLKDSAAGPTPGARDMTAFAGDLGMRMVAHGTGHGWMHLRVSDLPTTLQKLNLPAGRSAGSQAAPSGADEQRRDTWRIVQALRRRADVAYAQPNFIRRAVSTPNDPLFPFQWNLDLIHAPEAWDLTLGSSNVIVAVIDTGVLLDHPDLQGKFVAGGDFISNPPVVGIGYGSDPVDSTGSGDFHGTHVAGIIAAGFDNGIGVAGVGGATRIMPVRVLGPNGGTDLNIARAIRWAAGIATPNDDGSILPGANPRADIINLSLGGPSGGNVLAQAVDAARAAGVIVIAAAGNSASSASFYPADYPGVVAVSAVDAVGQRAFYSNFGSAIDLAAPGGDPYADLQPDGYADGILSTMGNNAVSPIEYTYAYYEGTSFAAPHVAGVAALMKAVWTGMTPELFQADIENNLISDDLGAVGRDAYYGYGLIDAQKAVAAALDAAGGSLPPAVATVTPAAVHLDASSDTTQVTLSQVGSGTLALDSLSTDQSWLTVERTPGQNPGDFGQYTLTVVNHSSLPGGVQTATVAFVFPSQTLTVTVAVDVLPDTSASASTQYVSLFDAQNNKLVRQIAVVPGNGVYHYSFTGVPAGSYYVQSSSDLNDDYNLFDEGEAVGVYPSLGAETAITVQSDRSGLDFVTGFQQWPFLQPFASTAAVRLDSR